MAVYTTLDEAQIQSLLAQYDIGNLTAFSGIEKGVSNTNYYLHTTGKPNTGTTNTTNAGTPNTGTRYILTLFESRTDLQSLPFIFGFTRHLSEHALPVPKTILNKSGTPTTQIAGKKAAILSYLSGTDMARESLTPAHCHGFGTILAQMHLASRSFAPTQNNPLTPAYLQSLLDATQNQHAPARKILNAYQTADFSNLPRAAIHADLCQDNVFFDPAGTLTGVIDFYFSCTDFLLYDLAIAFNAWCYDMNNTPDPARARAFWAAYNTLRPITPPEYEHWPLMRSYAALRMYATRQYDWVFTPHDASVIKHDPAEYLAKLETHWKLPCAPM